MQVQVCNNSFKSNTRACRQYELQTIQRYTTGDESDTPPNNKTLIKASHGVTINLDKFRDELDNDSPMMNAETISASFEPLIEQKLMSDSINDALPSGADRVKSIRQVTTVIALQVLLSSICAVWLLRNETFENPIKVVAVVSLLASGLTFSWFGGLLIPIMVIFCFLVFSTSLPMTLALIGVVSDSQILTVLVIQFSGALLGLVLYAWTTEYEEWNSHIELVYVTAPVLFTSVVLVAVLGYSLLPTMATGICIGLLGLVYSDCAKDSIVPASTIDQLLADVLAVHVSVIGRAAFLLHLKFSRLARKANWF